MGEYLLAFCYPPTIMMQTSISRVQDSRLSRYSLPVPSTSTMSSRCLGWYANVLRLNLPMFIHNRLSPNWRLFGRLRSARTFSVNSVPRVVAGTARLCTSFIDMPFPVKVKAPSLKGLFRSSKKRTKVQGHGAPEVQSEVPDG